MKMKTFGPISRSELKTHIEETVKEINEEIKLTVLYLPIESPHSEIISEIRNIAKSPLIGCTTGNAGFTEKGFTTNGIVGAFLYGKDLNIKTACLKDLTNNFKTTISEGVSALQPGKLSGHTILVLSDYSGIDGELLTNTIKSNIPPFWKCFGGFAGDNWTFKGAKVFYDNLVFNGGAVLAYINSPDKSGIGVKHGFKPLVNSKTFKVTDIDSNILKELDGKPALDVYEEELIKAGLFNKGEDIIKKAAKYPLGIKTIFGEGLKIRTPLSLDGKKMILAGSVPNESELKIVVGETDSLLSAAKEIKQYALADLGKNNVIGQFIIDCAGRYQMLESKYIDEVKNFRIDETSPMIGFTSYGEIAKFGVSFVGFHNTTAVSCLW